MTMIFKDCIACTCPSVCPLSTEYAVVENDTKSENRTCISDPSGMPESQSLCVRSTPYYFYPGLMHLLYSVQTRQYPIRLSAFLFSPMSGLCMYSGLEGGVYPDIAEKGVRALPCTIRMEDRILLAIREWDSIKKGMMSHTRGG